VVLIACPECGTQVSSRAPVCPKCGFPLVVPTARQSSAPIIVTAAKSRSVAIFLALLLGGLGAHKFYIGKPGVGVLYMVFCWTFIPAIVGLLEGIQYLLMSDETFQKKLSAKQL